MRALWIFLFIASAWAKDGSHVLTCNEVLDQLNAELRAANFDRPVRDAVQKILADTQLNTKQKAKAIYAVQLHARLALESEAVRTRVLDLIANRVQHSAELDDTWYDQPENGQPDHIKIGMPESMRDSFLYHALMAHEVEHAIQAYRVEEAGARMASREDRDEYQDRVREREFGEIGAMYAEFNYLNLIPIEMRQAEARENDAAMAAQNKPARDFARRLLTTTAKDGELHVTFERNRNRYSRRNINQIPEFRQQYAASRVPVIRRRILGLAAGAAGLLVSMTSFAVYCQGLTEAAKPDANFILKGCYATFGNPVQIPAEAN